MSEPKLPSAHSLRAYALKHNVDPRTILKVLRGEPVKGIAYTRAKSAADDWRKAERVGQAS